MGMAVTILTDIIHFGVFYPLANLATERAKNLFHFSAGMAILSLLLKPATCFFLYQMYRERGGDYNVNFGKCRETTARRETSGTLEFRPGKFNKCDLISF